MTRKRSKTMLLLDELNLINECQAAFRRNHYRHPRRFTKRLRSSRMMSMTPRCGAFPRAIRRRGPLCALAHRVTRNVGPSASRRLRLVYVEWQPECKRRSTSQLACHCDVTSKRLREQSANRKSEPGPGLVAANSTKLLKDKIKLLDRKSVV